MIVLRSCDTFQTRTIVLYLHAMVVSKLSCVNLLQGKFEESETEIHIFGLRRILIAISISLVREFFNSKLVFIKVYFTQLAQIFAFKNAVYANVLPSCLFAMVTPVQISLIFPPKDLEKYGRSKYACAVFF